MDELPFASAAEIARRIRSRDVSCREVVLAQHGWLDAAVASSNAVVSRADTRALAEADRLDADLAAGRLRGPLHGVPVTIKDSHDTEGIVTTGGTLGLSNHVPQRDSTAVARLRGAGAVVLGKTNTPELTLSFETDNLVYGRTCNPYDSRRSPGGSSGGAAAVLAAGGSALDLGSDIGGSIRVPAAWCGVAGLKPTPGRVPRTGHILPGGGPLDTWGTIGPMARRVQDLELAFRVVAGPDGVDPHVGHVPNRSSFRVRLESLAVGLCASNGFDPPSPDVARALTAAADAIRGAGARVDSVALRAAVEAWLLTDVAFAVDLGEVARDVLRCAGTRQTSPQLAGIEEPLAWLAGTRSFLAGRCGPWLTPFLERVAAGDRGAPLSTHERMLLYSEVERTRAALRGLFGSHDAILCPASAGVAPPHRLAAWLPQSYTSWVNLAGLPAVVVPVGLTAGGLPTGVQIVARPWSENVALALAAVVEGGTGGWRPPPHLV